MKNNKNVLELSDFELIEMLEDLLHLNLKHFDIIRKLDHILVYHIDDYIFVYEYGVKVTGNNITRFEISF